MLFFSLTTLTSARVNCAGPHQHNYSRFLGPVRAHDQIFVRSKNFYVFGNGASLSTRGCMVFLNRRHIYRTVIQHECTCTAFRQGHLYFIVWSGNLLLVFTSTVILDFGPRRDPRRTVLLSFRMYSLPREYVYIAVYQQRPCILAPLFRPSGVMLQCSLFKAARQF
jgi:hypothetical protein